MTHIHSQVQAGNRIFLEDPQTASLYIPINCVHQSINNGKTRKKGLIIGYACPHGNHRSMHSLKDRVVSLHWNLNILQKCCFSQFRRDNDIDYALFSRLKRYNDTFDIVPKLRD